MTTALDYTFTSVHKSNSNNKHTHEDSVTQTSNEFETLSNCHEREYSLKSDF